MTDTYIDHYTDSVQSSAVTLKHSTGFTYFPQKKKAISLQKHTIYILLLKVKLFFITSTYLSC